MKEEEVEEEERLKKKKKEGKYDESRRLRRLVMQRRYKEYLGNERAGLHPSLPPCCHCMHIGEVTQ
jgi:hypothetical protein